MWLAQKHWALMTLIRICLKVLSVHDGDTATFHIDVNAYASRPAHKRYKCISPKLRANTPNH